MTNKVGYIGLGLMGRPAALNLIKAGYPLYVYARRAEMMGPLSNEGATPCNSVKEVAENCDIIFTNVSDTSDVVEVVTGPEGIIHAAKAGTILVDMSTISPTVTREIATQLAAKGIEMLDAPVSGGTQGAIDGTLSFMVGGKKELFEKVLPLFKVMGSNIVHIGDHGAGQVTKACNQLLVAQTMAAIGEAFLFAKSAKVDPAKVRDALMGGFAGSRILEVHGKRMLENNFEPGFKAKLHQKDMRIVQETAAEFGLTLPGTEIAAGYIRDMVAHGKGELDSSALVTELETFAKQEK